MKEGERRVKGGWSEQVVPGPGTTCLFVTSSRDSRHLSTQHEAHILLAGGMGHLLIDLSLT